MRENNKVNYHHKIHIITLQTLWYYHIPLQFTCSMFFNKLYKILLLQSSHHLNFCVQEHLALHSLLCSCHPTFKNNWENVFIITLSPSQKTRPYFLLRDALLLWKNSCVYFAFEVYRERSKHRNLELQEKGTLPILLWLRATFFQFLIHEWNLKFQIEHHQRPILQKRLKSESFTHFLTSE